MELINNEGLIVILAIVFAVTIVALTLLLSVIKLVHSTNKDILAKFHFETKVKDIKSQADFEIKAQDKKEKK